jgi:hypothetical protein
VASIFVSYARESETAVQSLAADVESLDHKVWVDHDLKGGREWWDQILAHIRDCHVFMMTLSPESLASAACKREYSYAAELGKPILPILIAEGVSLQTLPSKLSQIQYVDYRKRDVASALKLANALSAVPAALALPDPLPDPPGAPVSYLGGIAEQIDGDKALDAKDQSALVSSLRRALRETETKADARHLLSRLRKRQGLYADIRDEIDELLESQPGALGDAPGRADAETARKEAEKARTVETVSAETFGETRPASSATRTTTVSVPAPQASERLICAVVGIGIGYGLGLAMVLVGIGFGATSMTMAVGGAVAGAISGKRPYVISAAIAGGVLGTIAFVMAGNMAGDGWGSSSMSLAYGFPPGMIVGALAGVLIAKKRSGA